VRAASILALTLAIALFAPAASADPAHPVVSSPTAGADAVGAPWRPPVDGTVARLFDLGADPFEAGRHRGVDLAAAPGAAVRAPCAGRVEVAGTVGTSGRVVTLLCGRWRVTHMPLATIAVRRGVAVDRGTLLGTVAPSREHAGLHLGVRRHGTRFGYVDPLRFLAGTIAAPPPVIGRAPPPRSRRPPRLGPAPRAVPALRVASPPVTAPTPRAVPALRFAPSPAAAGSNPGAVAPWPAWAGLALVLAGAGVRWRRAAARDGGPATVARARASPVRR
jgi:Peptidase family M23